MPGDKHVPSIRALRQVRNRKDELIRELWCLYATLSDHTHPTEFPDEDLTIWTAVTTHSAVQDRLDEQKRAD